MTEVDIHLFPDYARDTEYYNLFYLALFTGLRRSELIALRWSDVDFLLCQLSVTRSAQQLHKVEPHKRVTFKDTKTQKSRRLVDLSPSTCEMLREHRNTLDKIRQSLNFSPTSGNDLVYC